MIRIMHYASIQIWKRSIVIIEITWYNWYYRCYPLYESTVGRCRHLQYPSTLVQSQFQSHQRILSLCFVWTRAYYLCQRLNYSTISCCLLPICIPVTYIYYAYVMGEITMRNIVPRVGIEPVFLAFPASVLPITPHMLPDVTTMPTPTCLCICL